MRPPAEGRRYQDSHPWIDFRLQVRYEPLWTLLGEAYSKCQHLSGTPLQPALAMRLSSVYMVKGAVATTAIEGNTLTEDEVTELIETGRQLPPSQRYLQQEVENVVAALRDIDARSRSGVPLDVGPAWIREQNRRVLEGLDEEEHVAPGVYTATQLVAGNYRGAPPGDVDYLMDRLGEWLKEWLAPLEDPTTPDDVRFYQSFFAAVLGHLYIAWIHPFGNGNGRTARLLECAILAHSGVVPWVSSNLLSDHYNRTRSHYYHRLDRASRDRDVLGFLVYSAQGLVDMLREQIRVVQQMQRQVAWVNYVHERLKDEPTGHTQHRRRELVLAMDAGAAVRRSELRHLTPRLAEMYAGKGDKTVTRDVNHLVAHGLVRRTPDGYEPCIDVMDAFLPATPRSSGIPGSPPA